MSEMVERVASAIFETIHYDCDGAGFLSREAARAAIEAMREPTDAMINPGCDAAVNSGGNSILVWRAMIDAAINED